LIISTRRASNSAVVGGEEFWERLFVPLVEATSMEDREPFAEGEETTEHSASTAPRELPEEVVLAVFDSVLAKFDSMEDL